MIQETCRNFPENHGKDQELEILQIVQTLGREGRRQDQVNVSFPQVYSVEPTLLQVLWSNKLDIAPNISCQTSKGSEKSCCRVLCKFYLIQSFSNSLTTDTKVFLGSSAQVFYKTHFEKCYFEAGESVREPDLYFGRKGDPPALPAKAKDYFTVFFLEGFQKQTL